MTVSLRGLGAMVSYQDMGDGITPENFQVTCCTGMLSLQPDAAHIVPCNKFKNANPSIFGDCFWGPCSECARTALSYGALPAKVVPVPPPSMDATPGSPTYGQAINPCTGLIVETPQDAIDLQTCLATLQSAEQTAANQEAARGILSTQCAAMKQECADRTFGSFMSPNKACSDCDFDFTKGSSLALVAGLMLFGFVFLKTVR
jgi:hypothetical protein